MRCRKLWLSTTFWAGSSTRLGWNQNWIWNDVDVVVSYWACMWLLGQIQVHVQEWLAIAMWGCPWHARPCVMVVHTIEYMHLYLITYKVLRNIWRSIRRCKFFMCRKMEIMRTTNLSTMLYLKLKYVWFF